MIRRVNIKLPWYMRNTFSAFIAALFRNAHYPEKRKWCWSCKKFTKHFDCQEHSKHGYFCLSCCEWDVEGDWETGYQDIPLCPKCELELVEIRQ